MVKSYKEGFSRYEFSFLDTYHSDILHFTYEYWESPSPFASALSKRMNRKHLTGFQMK
jgi:hypothetical protein